MKKALLIAEKDSLMEIVEAVYNRNKSKIPYEIKFAHFSGHTVELKSPGELNPEWGKWKLNLYPLIPDKFEYKVSKTKTKIYKRVIDKISSEDFDFLINCCDAGREGQAIFHTFYRHTKSSLPVKRLWTTALTDEVVVEKLINLRDDLKEPALVNMTEASILRAQFDWLIGMNYSPVYTLKANAREPIGVGRVMTPTLAIIVNRELEIKNFVSKNFFELEGDFGIYSGKYYKMVDGKENYRFDTKEDLENLRKQLSFEKNKSKVISAEKKKVSKYAPELYNLASIQADANRIFKYTSQETLDLVQSLYEKKLLSYPRTDSRHITSSMTKDLKKMLACLKSVPNLGEYVDKILAEPNRVDSVSKDKKYVDDSKVSDHYAIIPTGDTADLSTLSVDEGNIYTLVAKRFVAIFLDPQVTEKSVIITDNNGHTFKTNGTILLDKGFTVLYDTKVNNKMLPPVNKGDELTLAKTNTLSKKTSPPNRYDEASLVEIMEDVARLVEDKELKDVLKEAKGIGTSATRASIIEKLIKNKYIHRKKGAIYPTDYGISIIEGLRGQEITLPELTAEWETKLSNIEKCIYDPKDFYEEMITYIKDRTEEMKNMTVNIENSRVNLGTCPKCGKHSVIEQDKGFSCEGYKESTCDFVIWKNTFGGSISLDNAKLLVEGKETAPIEFTSKNKKSKYTATLKLKDDFSLDLKFSNKESAPVGKCPVCGKDVIANAKAYGCSGYSEGTCKFAIWKNVASATVTEEDAKNLLAGKPTAPKKCKSKAGKEFTASFILEENTVKFKF